MAPSPTIPTSFVPKQPVQSTPRFRSSGGNTFLFIASILLGISVLGSLGVFAYEQYLMGIRDTKKAEVESVQKNIDSTAVEDFIKTRDRFKSAMTLLDSHVVSSQFFDLLEDMTLQNVRFNSLSLKLEDDHTAKISMEGVARTFNALAAQSSEFAKEDRLKRAIFSDITVDLKDQVTFSFSAELSNELLTMTTEEAEALTMPESAPAPEVVPLPVEPSVLEAAQTSEGTTTPLPALPPSL